MSVTFLISIVVFVGVAALVAGVAMFMRGDPEAEVEERLSVLTGAKKRDGKSGDGTEISELLAKAREGTKSPIEQFVSQYLNLSLLFEQANVNLSVPNFLAIIVGLAVVGFALPMVAGLSAALAPAMAGFLAILPIFWLLMRRKRRLNKFASQLPEALELIARALRAGHSLAAGFSLVAQEMSAK